MEKNNLTKKKALQLTGIIVLILGIILSFCPIINELFGSIILDGETGKVPLGIAPHIIVITIFMIVSDCLFYIANTQEPSGFIPKNKLIPMHILYAIGGICFSIATACTSRSKELLRFRSNLLSSPSWYYEDIVSLNGFDNIQKVADKLSSISIVFYIFTVLSAVAIAWIIYISKKDSSQAR